MNPHITLPDLRKLISNLDDAQRETVEEIAADLRRAVLITPDGESGLALALVALEFAEKISDCAHPKRV